MQDKNWPYFINRIIEFSQVNILNNTRANFEIVKNLYNELLTSVGINLHEYFMNLDIDVKRKIDTDLTNNNYFTWDPHETFAQSRILATYRDFFYDTGRFPGRNTLILVPMANMPHFINANDWISPHSLYETYVGSDMQGLTSVQFLAAFNRFLGGDKEICRNAMSEFFHNLSWQALTNDNDSIKIEFTAITELVKSINLLLQKKIYDSKRKTALINAKIQNKILSKEPEIHKTEDDFNIDFNVTDSQIVWDEDNTDLVPVEFDTDKIVMTDDGDVILTEPDNMQVEEKALVPLSNDTIMLPPEENMTDVISTRNIVVKRKQPDISIGQIKKVKNETNISIKHPIFRKMEKQKKADERLAKAIASAKPLEIKMKDKLLAIEGPDELLPIEGPRSLHALMPPSTGPLASIDAEKMRRLPWVDFNVVLDNTDKHNREQVIFDILQDNMPNLGEDLHYIDHDPETNIFSIKKDEKADEITDLVESIRVIDARLATEILSKKERNSFLKRKALKIGELRKRYKANTLADILENKLSKEEKDELENEVLLKLQELNKDGDRYYFEFNESTQEFEILLDTEVRINAIVFAVMQIDKVINNVNTTHTRRLELMTEKDKLLDYLKAKGAKLLADSLR